MYKRQVYYYYYCNVNSQYIETVSCNCVIFILNKLYSAPDLQDCRSHSTMCDRNAACTEGADGFFVCVCNSDYRGDGRTCTGKWVWMRSITVCRWADGCVNMEVHNHMGTHITLFWIHLIEDNYQWSSLFFDVTGCLFVLYMWRVSCFAMCI